MSIKLGADPEIFYRENNVLTSAFGLIQGTKDNPFKVEHGAVQVDGMALEFNIDPADTVEAWCFNLHAVLAQLREMVPGELDAIPVAEFGEEYIRAQPDAAKELGCDPDFSAYTGKENPKPDENLPFRTAAGHVHFGLTDQWDITSDAVRGVCCSIVKQLDAYLGVPSVLLDHCDKRREMYGQAGAFRPKFYGLEYRVLSNFWLKSDPLMSWVFEASQRAVEDWQAKKYASDVFPEEHIQHIINTSDRKAAAELVDILKLEVPCV